MNEQNKKPTSSNVSLSDWLCALAKVFLWKQLEYIYIGILMWLVTMLLTDVIKTIQPDWTRAYLLPAFFAGTFWHYYVNRKRT